MKLECIILIFQMHQELMILTITLRRLNADILIMSDYLIRNFPEFYKYFAEKEFTWNRTGG